MISKAMLRNPTPEDRERLLERADIVRRTRALEERIRLAQHEPASDQTLEPVTPHSNGAEIATLPANA